MAGNEVELVDARYTPTGRQIVFLHAIDAPNTPTARYSLDVMNADGSGRRVLVRRPNLKQFAISRDGTIAFLALSGRSDWSLYLTSIAHPRPRLVYRSWPLGPFAWSRAGGLFVYGDPCGSGFCKIDPRTRKMQAVPLAPHLFEGANQAPAVSPDETRIAFYSPFGPAGARVFGLDGRIRRNIKDAYLCVGPFAPDGAELALADYCGGTTVRVSVFDFRSRRVRSLALHVPVPQGGSDRLLDWQPLGSVS